MREQRGQSALTISGALKGALVPYSSCDSSSRDVVEHNAENGAGAQDLFSQKWRSQGANSSKAIRGLKAKS